MKTKIAKFTNLIKSGQLNNNEIIHDDAEFSAKVVDCGYTSYGIPSAFVTVKIESDCDFNGLEINAKLNLPTLSLLDSRSGFLLDGNDLTEENLSTIIGVEVSIRVGIHETDLNTTSNSPGRYDAKKGVLQYNYIKCIY